MKYIQGTKELDPQDPLTGLIKKMLEDTEYARRFFETMAEGIDESYDMPHQQSQLVAGCLMVKMFGVRTGPSIRNYEAMGYHLDEVKK